MSEAIKPTLLPCPFCGGDARNDAHADDCYFVLHRRLNSAQDADLSMHLDVLAAWNRRSDQLAERNAELVEVLRSIDTRLRICLKGPISAAEAYDSFYQELVAEALAKCQPKESTP